MGKHGWKTRGEDADNGNEDAKKTSQKGGESARKRKEVSERRGGWEWEGLPSQPGEQAPPSAQTRTAGTTEQRCPGRGVSAAGQRDQLGSMHLPLAFGITQTRDSAPAS